MRDLAGRTGDLATRDGRKEATLKWVICSALEQREALQIQP
jgi:hypothetical protein